MQHVQDPDELLTALRSGDRAALARAITLIESARTTDRTVADQLVERALPFSGNAVRLGITGIPGVGKSTLIDAFGRIAIDHGKRVAVLATDPSSARSGGSILGDKTRMEILAREPNAFIRPTASGGHLGGVARRTRETIVLCEAAGFDLVLVETVGVGQSELAVDGMTDLNLLLMITGAGDELQGIKRGIMESADVVVLTKADTANPSLQNETRASLRNAIGFLPARDHGGRPAVLSTDALTGRGLPELYTHVQQLHERVSGAGHLAHRRQLQNVHWMHHALREGLMEVLLKDPATMAAMSALEERVKDGSTSPFSAAAALLDRFRTSGARLP